jgi:uncharacterized membrane protein HdeD (DUF308 family)
VEVAVLIHTGNDRTPLRPRRRTQPCRTSTAFQNKIPIEEAPGRSPGVASEHGSGGHPAKFIHPDFLPFPLAREKGGSRSLGDHPMTAFTTPSQGTEHRARWKWFLALGVLLLVLGGAGIGFASLVEITTVLIFGPLLLASSLVQFLLAFFVETGRDRILRYVAAGAEMILGFVVIAHPLPNVINLITVIAVGLITIGLIHLARALMTRDRGREWAVVVGIIVLIMGVSVLVSPDPRLWFVGVCLAGVVFCHGVSWSALGLATPEPPKQ